MRLFFLIGFCCLYFTSINAQDDKFKIVVSASMLADMAENIIAAEDEVVQCIVPIGGDPHLHEPTPRDAKLVANADMIIINGLTFEGWIEKLIKSSGSKAKVVTVTDGIQPIASDDYKNSTDPHAWMDVTNVYTYIKNIKDALVDMRPENKEMYEFNHNVYRKSLEELDAYVVEQANKIPQDRRVLITSHDAFEYFGRRYGVGLESVVGISTEAEAQTSDVIRLTKLIKEKNIPAVFIESTINPKLLKELAKSTGVALRGPLFADSLGPKEGEAGTYIDMIRFNIDRIVEGLSLKKDGAKKELEVVDTGDSPTNFLVWGLLGFLLLGGFFFVFNKMNQ